MFSKNGNKMVYVIGFLFVVLISSLLTFSLPVFIMQVLLMSITIPLLINREMKMIKLYLVIFVVSLLFVFLVYFANSSTYDSSYYMGGSDDLTFENDGKIIMESGVYNPAEILETGIIGWWNNAPFFAVYISGLHLFSDFFGSYTTFMPRIINSYFLLWICMILEYFLKKYANFTSKKTFFTIMLFGLTPNIHYINAHVFRDTFNLLQVLLIVIIIDFLLSKGNYIRKIFYIIALFILIFTTYYTRINSLVFAAGLCFLILSEKFRINKILLFIVVIPILLMSNFTETIRLDYFLGSYGSYVLEIAGDGLSKFVFEQPLIPLGIIFRSLYALITPFPNFFGLFKNSTMILLDFTMSIIFIGVIIQILFIPFIVKRALKFDWLSLSFLLLFFSVIGTTFTFRHVLFYYPFMVALGIDGYMSMSQSSRKKILFLSGLVGIAFALIYLALKIL